MMFTIILLEKIIILSSQEIKFFDGPQNERLVCHGVGDH
jgi:hypothetical protein